MPRTSRTVFPGLPHHITQRGNRKEDVFFDDADRSFYLQWLQEYSEKHHVDVLAYCLMTNHIHLVLVPETEEGLQQVLKPLHMRYAQHVNRRQGWNGHLWQGRFFSSPLDDAYLWTVIRYVELNPVQAGLINRAEDYPWSSAAAHCGLKKDGLLATLKKNQMAVGTQQWSSWLAAGTDAEKIQVLRRNTSKNLPCGSAAFIKKLEKHAGRELQYKPQGRPKSVENAGKG